MNSYLIPTLSAIGVKGKPAPPSLQILGPNGGRCPFILNQPLDVISKKARALS